jgi:serine protease AprX
MNVVEPPGAGGVQVDPEVASAARAKVEASFGAHLAAKASDAFCLAVAQPTGLEVRTRTFRVGAEAMPTPEATPAVIEFADRPDADPEGSRAIRLRATAAILRDLQDAGAEEAIAAKGAGPAGRQLVIGAVRDSFFRDAGAVHAELERSGAAFTGPSSPLESTTQPPFTDVCWLNRTIRARADARALAEVVADVAVTRVDLPRRLEPDIFKTRDVVEARGYSSRNHESGEGIVVAVIDTEVALGHPGFGGRVVQKRNFTQEPFGTPGDHGTAVAGIIGSEEGMAPGVTIYNYKVLATNRFLNGTDFDGALALQRALEDGVHVANCSWGAGPAGDGTSREARACDAAWGLGLTIVKSAGNAGPGASTLTTPADAAGVIVVGATDRKGQQIEDYSSRGPTPAGVERPHLAAPGGSLGDGIQSALVGGGYGEVGRGTSFAAPHVTGLVALLLAAKPDLEPDDLRQRLLDKCTPIGAFTPADAGAGLVALVAPDA